MYTHMSAACASVLMSVHVSTCVVALLMGPAPKRKATAPRAGPDGAGRRAGSPQPEEEQCRVHRRR